MTGGAHSGEQVRMMGRSSDVHARNVGGAPDSRDGVVTLMSRVGFTEVNGTDAIGTQSMSAYAQQLGRLEREYGAIGAVPTVLVGADGSGFYAAAGSVGDGAVLMLNRQSAGNAARMAKAHAAEEQSGFKMPTDGRLTSQAGYTVTHEYGHLLQNALYQRAKANGYNGTEEQFRAGAKRAITRKAVGTYGGRDSQLSRYGHYNTAEFFAEAFANSQLGRPNAFGKAMNDYLRDHKLR